MSNSPNIITFAFSSAVDERELNVMVVLLVFAGSKKMPTRVVEPLPNL
ncbi:MAG: hypothetical protein KKE01_00160 [Candidatus Omnitrophica bacterium]|nr:hypothetical protein [Candidatus Omnitrophota bacterium]